MLRFRKLCSGDTEKLAAHLLRLEPDDRRNRFGGTQSDAQIQRFCRKLDWTHTSVIGFFHEGEIGAAVELRTEPNFLPRWAEVAFSVERRFQGQGVGSTLMRRILIVARNSGIARLTVFCLPENWRMRHLLEKFEARSTVDIEEVLASITLPPPDPLSLVQEVIDDSSGGFTILLDRWSSDMMDLLLPRAA